MHKRRKGWTRVEFWLAWALLLSMLGVAGAALVPETLAAQATPAPAIATTAVTDTVYRADGTAASGTVLISWPAFTLATGASVPAGSTAVTLGANGALNVNLVANAGSTPMGSYYTVVYHLDDGTVTREYWVVPVTPVGGSGAVQVSAIRSTVLPASVAMQTVSKAYVDTAIATAVGGHPLDASTPYVVKTGDTMTGPLVLPGDPTTPLQASDKHYVDTQVTALGAGVGQKVSTNPQATQVVTQPAGTQLEVNNLNGAQYATQYVTGAGTVNAGNNGIANAASSPDCAGGCDIVAEHTYPSTEQVTPATLNNGTHVTDHRNGQELNSYFNPQGPGANNAAQTIDLVSTESAAAINARTNSGQIFSTNLMLTQEGLAGGNNQNDTAVQGQFPYFKTTYSAEQIISTYNTVGQHVQVGQTQTCYGVGDCLAGSHYLVSSGGYRDDGDEATHPFDIAESEDSLVFTGSCASGCTAGATTLAVNVATGAGTQGEGRFLLDVNPAKTITTGVLTGGSTAGRQASATFSGTSFPVSVLLETAQTIPTQVHNVAPGTVTVPIVTNGVPAGFQTSTAALPAASGVACVIDANGGDNRTQNFETAAYTVVDGSHLQLTLNRVHNNGATIAVGGLCGYGLEQTVDTTAGLRQVFPVAASTSPTSLLYSGAQTAIVGQLGTTSAYVNESLAVATIARRSNVVSVTFAGSVLSDVNGLILTVQGVTDPSYNGRFVVTTTGPNTLTYTDNGPDSTSTGGTLSVVTGSFVLYPMAEVLTVYNPATKAVDGQLTLAANTVPWAAGDAVEEPHYYQQAVYPDTETAYQTLPRPSRTQSAGLTYATNVGPGVTGYAIYNAVPASNYFGNGGTHTVPDIGFRVGGPWNAAMDVQAGDTAAIRMHCNSHGCGRWNSTYSLFALDAASGADAINYSPQSSTLLFELGGAGYQFTPQALTANTINVTNLNAGSVHGLFQGTVQAASLPVFLPSGASHALGAVPDPGPAAGVTRFLREDGTWAQAGNQVSSAGGYTVAGPAGMPERGNLLGEYLLTEGAGTVAHDTSGAGNDATINGPSWEGTQDLNFTANGEYVGLPLALNATKTWQFAVYSPIYGTTKAPQAPGYGIQSAFPVNPSLLCGTDQQHLCLIAGSNGRSMQFVAFGADNMGSAEPMTPGWHVFTLLCGSNANGVVTKTRYLYDGAEVSGYTNQGDAGTCPALSSGNYQIGGSSAFTGTWWFGKVGAAWAWSQPLSFGEGVAAAQSALAYLKQKGVQTQFHAIVQTTPVVIAGFDSRTYGVQQTPTSVWPVAMSLTDPTYARINLGSPGQTSFDGCVQFDLTYGQQLGAGSAPAIIALWGGVNDLLYTQQTAQQIATNLKCMVTHAKALGARVVLATEISCANAASCDQGKDALDTILRAQAYSWGVDNLADLATDPHLGPDGASANQACFPDALHPSQACEPYITAIMQNAINELLGSTETARHQDAAAAYQEVAGDRYLDLTGSASQTVTLPDCTGYSLPRQVLNLGTGVATVSPAGGQTLLGNASLAAGARGTFLPVPGAPAVGGCKWERTE